MMETKRKFLDKLEGCPEWTKEMLNPKLVEKQELTEENIQAIIDLHNRRLHLFHHLKKLDPETAEGRTELREAAKTLEEIEYDMQTEWNFPQSRSHHSWWYEIPHCRCPYYDNRDAWGTDQRYIRPDCPVHGNE